MLHFLLKDRRAAKFISEGEAKQITVDFLDIPEDQVNDLKRLLQ